MGEEFPLQCPSCGGNIRLIAFMHGTRADPEDPHTPRKTTRAASRLSRPGPTDRLGRAHAGPSRPRRLSTLARRAALDRLTHRCHILEAKGGTPAGDYDGPPSRPDTQILGATGYPGVDSTHPQRCTFRPPRAALFNRRSQHGLPYRQESVFRRFGRMLDICVGKTSMRQPEAFPAVAAASAGHPATQSSRYQTAPTSG